MGGFSHNDLSPMSSWLQRELGDYATKLYSSYHLFFNTQLPLIFTMKLLERRRIKIQFKLSYGNANQDERREMILDYIVDYQRDMFINKMERKYNRKYWSKW